MPRIADKQRATTFGHQFEQTERKALDYSETFAHEGSYSACDCRPSSEKRCLVPFNTVHWESLCVRLRSWSVVSQSSKMPTVYLSRACLNNRVLLRVLRQTSKNEESKIRGYVSFSAWDSFMRIGWQEAWGRIADICFLGK
jgi:hypothetical protein